jgi:hypothetical protein
MFPPCLTDPAPNCERRCRALLYGGNAETHAERDRQCGGASTPVVSFLCVREVERAIKRGGERLLQGALLLATAASAGDAATLTFRCAPQNDLYRARREQRRDAQKRSRRRRPAEAAS